MTTLKISALNCHLNWDRIGRVNALLHEFKKFKYLRSLQSEYNHFNKLYIKK